VQDIQAPFEILHAEDGVQIFGEHGHPPVGEQANNPPQLFARLLGADVHRIFGDEDPTIRGDTNHGGMADDGGFSDKFDFPAGQRHWHAGECRSWRHEHPTGGRENKPPKDNFAP